VSASGPYPGSADTPASLRSLSGEKRRDTGWAWVVVEWCHGKTYPPPTPPEHRGARAALPNRQRAQRTDLVAAPVAARAGLHRDGARRRDGLPRLLDRPDRQAVQQGGAGGDGEPPAYHLLSAAAGALAEAAGGVARGAGRSRSQTRGLDGQRRGGVDGGKARPPRLLPPRMELFGSPEAQPPSPAAAPCPGRRRPARRLQKTCVRS
jgi:hypothetical protein